MVLLKAYQNSKRNFQYLTYDVTIPSLLETMGEFGPLGNQANDITFERLMMRAYRKCILYV